MGMLLGLLAVLLLVVGLTGLLVYGTLKKNRMGINVEARRCPQCGAALPRVRKPANLRQALWGGSTCAVCGTETDKWGRIVAGKGSR